MFSSLRGKLWLSYALLIAVLLAVVTAALVFALLRNPAVYTSVVPRLQLAGKNALPRISQAMQANPGRLGLVLQRESQATKLRLLVVDLSGKVLGDSESGQQGAIATMDMERVSATENSSRPGIVRDASRVRWVYSAVNSDNGYYVVAATPLPRLPIITLVRNEVISPILISGAAALVISFLLALAMANWIASPLQRMASAAQHLATGESGEIPEAGPDEVKLLAQSLNEMNRQMHASQQAQRDFVANVSHELKTPLTSIQGFAQAMVEGAANSPESLRDSANVIYQESRRMYRLVLDLLTLARLEGGTADLQYAPVDLGQVLAGVTGKLQVQAAQAGVTLTWLAPTTGLLAASGDGDRLAQVFTNLVENALKFTPQGGRVTVQAKALPDSLLVEVADTGKGVAVEDRERIFERFYQADKARSGGGERGVGLGLPIARQIVLAHHGKIWVESQPGLGSQFFVQLPRAGSGGITGTTG